MKTVHVLSAMIGIVLLTTQGCGSGRSALKGEVHGEMSEDFIKALLAGNYQKTIGSVSSSDPLKVVPRSLDGCKPTIEGNKEDRDFDRIWVGASAVIDCKSGSDWARAKFSFTDEDDSLKYPKAGFSFDLEEAVASVTLSNRKTLEINVNPSQIRVSISDSSASLQLSSLFSLVSDPWQVSSGADISGSYTGNVNSPKAGDSFEASGFYKLAVKNIERIPDADFVIRFEAAFTVGLCRNRADLVSGELTAIDGQGNTLLLKVESCTKTLTYNGKPLQWQPTQTTSGVPRTDRLKPGVSVLEK